MSEEKKTSNENLPAFVKAAPELLPVWDWWVKEGKSTVAMLLVAALVVGGFYAGRNWLRGRDAGANQALVNAYAVDELETAVADYGSTKVGPALRLRLAKAYYDAARYEDALAVYDALVAKAGDNAAFADIAVVGRAYALEGQEKFKEAGAAFAQANTNSYLLLAAQLGAARCKALQGDKDGAAKDFDALKEQAKDEFAKTRIERMADAVKRHDPARAAARSLFDAANAAATAIDAEKAEKKGEAKKDDVKKVEPKPETKKGEQKPETKKGEQKPETKKGEPKPEAKKDAAPPPAAKK